MTDADERRLALVGRALEAFVLWARVLDGHRSPPFGELRLARAQLAALFYVAHASEPATPSALAEALGVTRGAVTQLVAGLVEAGLLEQHANETDARRRVLKLSEASRARLHDFERSFALDVAPHFAALTDAELNELVDMLDRLRGTK